MALVIWLVTGFINLFSSFCYAELALTFRTVGSDYVYIKEGLGELPGFLFLWVTTFFREAAARSLLSLTFATYFCQIFFGGYKQVHADKNHKIESFISDAHHQIS